jgi:hypothetical protein
MAAGFRFPEPFTVKAATASPISSA